MLLLACGALPLALTPAPADTLDDLVQKARDVRSFTATYSVSTTADPTPATVRIDFQAPDRARVDQTGASGSSSLWCVGGTLALRAAGSEPRSNMYGMVDTRAVRAELDATEIALATSFGDAPPPGELSTVVDMRWAFDGKEEKANYVIDAAEASGAPSPFGWLATLRNKEVEPVDAGERLVFTTDGGAFTVAVSKASAFVERLDGKSPNGEIHIRLENLELGAAIDPARFTLPAEAGQGRDVSPELRRAAVRVVEIALRGRIYQAIAGSAGEPWNAEANARIGAVLRAFHEHSVPATLTSWTESTRKKHEGVGKRLRELAASGKTPAEVEEVHRRELGYLRENLAKLEEGFLTRVSAPSLDVPLPRGAELVELEKEILAAVFEERVRAPTLAEFEAACRP